MNILTAYYYICSDILKDHLPCIPELKLTNAKTYCGKIYRENGEFKAIALSKFNLYVSDFQIEQEDIDEIIDTICHEFAHMYYWNHGQEHTETTDTMKDIVKTELNIKEANKKLNLINKKLEVA